MRDETVEHTGDGVVERMVELIEWPEEGRFIFEKVTGRLEEIGEETEKSTPNGMRREERGDGGEWGMEINKNKNAGEGEIDQTMFDGHGSAFATVAEAGTCVPVGYCIL